MKSDFASSKMKDASKEKRFAKSAHALRRPGGSLVRSRKT